MIHFLTTYSANQKYDVVETKSTGFLKVSARDYSEARVMTNLTLLISSIDGITHRRFFLIHNRFGPETVFKKWILMALGFVILFVSFI